MRQVLLTPCTDLEYAEFAELQVVEYARQLVLAGEVEPEHGAFAARQRLDELLADRLRTAGHIFWVARRPRDGSRVGWVWISPAPKFLGTGHERTRWLSQLTIDEPLRAQGWGRAALDATERNLAARGADELWLRVFDWNLGARRLYESSGYELVSKFPTDAHLRKRLPRSHERFSA